MKTSYLNSALKLARSNNTEYRQKLGAIVTDRDGYIIGVGQNTKKTHPLQARYGKNYQCIHMHAEIAALVDAVRYKSEGAYDWRGTLDDCDIYVARVLLNGQIALAKPCEGCMRAITEFNIRNVYWTENQEG